MNKRYVVFKSFLTHDEQQALCRESLECHTKHASAGDTIDMNTVPLLEASKTFSLGINCGGNVRPVLPLAASKLQQAFLQAQESCGESAMQILTKDSTPLTGLVLLYGPNAHMKPHYDSPTQPGQRHEWLACISLGATANFRCNQDVLQLESGDALVMDSMAVLHGVEGIVPSDGSVKLGLPPQCRLGILMWQANNSPMTKHVPANDALLDGVGNLFADSDDSDDE